MAVLSKWNTMSTVNWNRRSKFGIFALLAAILLVSSCKKDEEEVIDIGYLYFPNQAGTYVEYEVDSVHYGITVDTSHFYLREELVEEFIDGENQPAMRVERFKRNTTTDPWVLTDVWSQKRTTTTGERVEENQRFVRMVFPVEEGKAWNGNAYNDQEDWQYQFGPIDVPYSIAGYDFTRSVRVKQRNNVNLVDQEIAEEVYVRGVGMVYKRFTDINFQNFEITGVDAEWVMTDYGWIE